METIRSGIQQGYDDAYGILEALGAFEFEGVKEGIEKTKALIEEKLQAYYEMMRQKLGLEPAAQEESPTKTAVLAQGGVSALSATA